MNRRNFLRGASTLAAAATVPWIAAGAVVEKKSENISASEWLNKLKNEVAPETLSALESSTPMTPEEFQSVISKWYFIWTFEELRSKAGHLREFWNLFDWSVSNKNDSWIEKMNWVSAQEALSWFESNPLPVTQPWWTPSTQSEDIIIWSWVYSEIRLPANAPYSLNIQDESWNVDFTLPQQWTAFVSFSDYRLTMIAWETQWMETTEHFDVTWRDPFDLQVSTVLPIELIDGWTLWYNERSKKIERNWLIINERNVQNMEVQVSANWREPWIKTMDITAQSWENWSIERRLDLEFDSKFYWQVYVRIKWFDFPDEDWIVRESTIGGINVVEVPFDNLFLDNPVFTSDRVSFTAREDIQMMVTWITWPLEMITIRAWENYDWNPSDFNRLRSPQPLFYTVFKPWDDERLTKKLIVR